MRAVLVVVPNNHEAALSVSHHLPPQTYTSYAGVISADDSDAERRGDHGYMISRITRQALTISRIASLRDDIDADLGAGADFLPVSARHLH